MCRRGQEIGQINWVSCPDQGCAGGGGKGMRIVSNEGEFAEQMERGR